jgi:hypothetical protein
VTAAVAHFVNVLIEKDSVSSATSVVIATALITEYFDTLSLAPSQLLSGLTLKLKASAGVFALKSVAV